MNPEHQAKMQAGRERWREDRRREIVTKVETWREWVFGGKRGRQPPHPTDAEYATWRAVSR